MEPKLKNKNNKNFYIIYDGECAFCSKFIRFIDNKSYKSRFNIYVTANPYLLPPSKINLENIKKLSLKTIILIDEFGNIKIRSKSIEAIFMLTGDELLKIISIIISFFPRFLADIVYVMFSRIRRSVFSNTSCKIEEFKNINLL
tara:strand:+ start:476 stop:907 length:432 start_codon:yes stop_codon:yes gene_type:complete